MKSDLDALGAGYAELNSSDVTSASVLSPYQLVLWCPGYASGQLTSTELSYLYTYVQNGGNFFLPYNYGGYDYGSGTYAEMFGMVYAYIGGSWYFGELTHNGGYDYYGDPYIFRSGPGGTYDQYSQGSGMDWYTSRYYYGVVGNTRCLAGLAWNNYHESGVCRDWTSSWTDGEGIAATMSFNWDRITSTTPTNTGRKGLLWNLVEFIDPSLID